MARLRSFNAGLRSLTAGHEIDVITGSPAIDTTVSRTGGQSLKVTSAGATQYVKFQYRSASSNKIYVRIYVYIQAYPLADTTILGLVDNAEADQGGGLKLTTTGTVLLIGGSGTSFAAIGSPSSVLSLNTWYRLEISYDDSDVNNTLVARLEGTQFATGNGQEMGGNSVSLTLGDIDASTMTINFADVAVNDSTGSFQTGFPGDGKVLYLRPDAAGDANAFAQQTGGTAGAANNFTRVNETPPNDATSFNGSSVLNQEDLFNFGASGIGAGDTVNVVEVHGRFRNSTADATAKITFELEKTAAGTKTSSATITPNSTTFRTNVPSTTLPKNAPITTYQDPDAAAWTQTTVDSLQAGYKLTTAPGTAGRRIDVTTLWVVVDYTPSAATTRTITGLARITVSVLKTLLGRARVTASTTQTLLGRARIRVTTTQTLLGRARINVVVAQTLLGRARISAIVAQTLLGKSRITAATTQTIPGKSRITATTTQTLLGRARMQATALQSLLGRARIGLVSLQTLQGISRLSTAVVRTITGVARITGITTRTILGMAAIRATTTQAITGRSRIEKTTTQTLAGQARVTVATTRDLPAKSRITTTTSQTIPAQARVRATALQTLTGLSRISVVVLQTILAKAQILGVAAIVTQDILGKGRVTARTSRTIKGKAMILSTVSAPPPSVIFLTDGHLATRLGGNVYLPL